MPWRAGRFGGKRGGGGRPIMPGPTPLPPMPSWGFEGGAVRGEEEGTQGKRGKIFQRYFDVCRTRAPGGRIMRRTDGLEAFG